MQWDQATSATEISLCLTAVTPSCWRLTGVVTFYISPKQVWVILLWLPFVVLLPEGKFAGVA